MVEVNFMITSTKPFVPVTTLYIKENIKFLNYGKQGFTREMSQPNINNFDYMTDLTFRNINTLFVQSFKELRGSVWKTYQKT